MAPKKAAHAARAVTSPSTLVPGKASTRTRRRFIIIYGAPKGRKTTTASTLDPSRTKWIVSDSNCIPTLVAMDRLPPDENLYEVSSIPECIALVNSWLDVADKEGFEALGIDSVVVDSATQFSDWHQQDVAKNSGQRFMGDNAKNNGWQQFNAEFGQFLDGLAILAKHVNVILICHAKEKPDLTKGEWASINLSPQMSLKAGRLANWVFFQTCKDVPVEAKATVDEYIQNIIESRDGSRSGKEVVLNTQPVGAWIAAGPPSLKAEEPGNLQKLLEKEGLL